MATAHDHKIYGHNHKHAREKQCKIQATRWLGAWKLQPKKYISVTKPVLPSHILYLSLKLLKQIFFLFFILLITSTFLYLCASMLYRSNDFLDIIAPSYNDPVATLLAFSFFLGSYNSWKNNSYGGQMNEIWRN